MYSKRIYTVIWATLLGIFFLFGYQTGTRSDNVFDVEKGLTEDINDIEQRKMLLEKEYGDIWMASKSLYQDSVEIFSVDEASAEELPCDTLVIKPGIYSIGDKTYDMTEEGLYRFVYDNDSIKQTIVCGV